MLSLGQSQENAAVYAAIASAESGLDYRVINDTPSTGDYSVGMYQINYYGNLYGERAAKFGTPQQLIQGGLTRQSIAAMEIGQGGFTPWSTYTSGAYIKYLNGYSPPSGAPPGGGVPPTISQGSTGPYVSQLQTDLNVLGYGLAVDGDFGPRTYEAVVAFQQSARIQVDGVVGPQTWQALANAVATAQGGGNPGPTGIPGGSTPPSEPPGNIDPETVAGWSTVVSAAGPELGASLAELNSWARAIGGI